MRLLPLRNGVSQSTGNAWRTQEFMFGFYESADSIYEKNIVLSIRNDNIEKYNLAENDKIKVRISFGCNEWPKGSGKYFNEIRTGDITIIQKQPPTAQAAGMAAQSAAEEPQPKENQPEEGGENDDLPF